MNLMKAYFALLIMITGCGGVTREKYGNICFAGEFSQKVEKVSLKDEKTILNSHGKFIQVEGILHNNFEDVALYASHSSHSSEAVWLNLTLPDSIPDSELNKLNFERVTIIGKVNVGSRGHMGAYIAKLDSAFILCDK